MLKTLPKACIQATTFYLIRVDRVNANELQDLSKSRILAKTTINISEENNSLAMGRIGWLSQQKKNTDQWYFTLRANPK